MYISGKYKSPTMSEKQLIKTNKKLNTKVVPMLVKCPVIVPLIELQLSDQVCASKRGLCYMEVRDSVEKHECLGN